MRLTSQNGADGTCHEKLAPVHEQSHCLRALAVSAPFTINDDPLTFAVEGDVTSSLCLNLRYIWTISLASVRVLSGAGTPSITIDTMNLSGKHVTVGPVV